MKKLYKSLWIPAVAVIISALHFAPFFVLLNTSLKKMSDVSSRWKTPNYLFLDNYSEAIQNKDIGNAFVSTTIITVLAVLLIVFIGSMAAYPLSRRKTRANMFLKRTIMSVMMVPPLTILVPLYSTMVSLKGISTYWGIITMLVTFNLPLSIFLFTNFISAIPVALDEAASIDGCGYFLTYFRIILPQLKPVITSVVILSGVNCWNDYSFSLYLLQSPQIKTITMVIANYFSRYSNNMNIAAATAMLAVLPMVIVFIILQKQFVQGMVDSAIKE